LIGFDVTNGGETVGTYPASEVHTIYYFGHAGEDDFAIRTDVAVGWTNLQSVNFFGGEGNDTFYFGAADIPASAEVLAIGGGGDDRLKANASVPWAVQNSVRFYGGEGNDLLESAFGDDTLVGGNGNDRLSVETAMTVCLAQLGMTDCTEVKAKTISMADLEATDCLAAPTTTNLTVAAHSTQMISTMI